MSNVLINQGTQTAIKTDTVGTELYQYVKLDYGGAGASTPFTGTLGEVSNLVKGTINNAGTIQGGTMNVLVAGTVDTIGLLNANAWGTVVSTGTNTLGTIKPAVAGSSIYVTDIIISVGSTSNIVIASGGTSTPIIGTLQMVANGGMVANFRTPIFTTSGSALVYQQSVGCPLTITASGYVK